MFLLLGTIIKLTSYTLTMEFHKLHKLLICCCVDFRINEQGGALEIISSKFKFISPYLILSIHTLRYEFHFYHLNWQNCKGIDSSPGHKSGVFP